MINLYCPNCSVETAYDLDPFDNYDEYNQMYAEPLHCSSCNYEIATGGGEKEDLTKEYEETVFEDAEVIEDDSIDESLLEESELPIVDEKGNETAVGDALDQLLDEIQSYEEAAVA